MKNKFYTLSLALCFGIISPISYCMEKKDPFFDNDINSVNFNVDFFQKNDSDDINSMDFNVDFFQKDEEDSETKDRDFGNVDYDLWGISLSSLPSLSNTNNNDEKTSVEDQKNYLNNLPCNSKNIEYLEANYPYLYKELEKFDPKTNVDKFRDCLGRVYKNIPIAAVVSRFENVGFGAFLSYSSTEKGQIKEILTQLTKIYTSSLLLNEKLNDNENLEEKTKLIHFIEDVVITPIYGNDPNVSRYFQGYNRILAVLNFLYFKKDINNFDEYRWAIRCAWKNYLLGKDCNTFKKIFSESSKNLKPKLEEYLNGASKLRTENLSKKFK